MLPSVLPALFGRSFNMTLGRGALLSLLGIPLPVVLLLALFWR
jgi:hypothetical protein